jgi:hypothetical protein
MKGGNMSQLITATPPARRKPGRKKVRGALEFHKRTGRICWVLGYCEDCNGKVTADREEIEMLKLSIQREKKKLCYRLLMKLLERYER